MSAEDMKEITKDAMKILKAFRGACNLMIKYSLSTSHDVSNKNVELKHWVAVLQLYRNTVKTVSDLVEIEDGVKAMATECYNPIMVTVQQHLVTDGKPLEINHELSQAFWHLELVQGYIQFVKGYINSNSNDNKGGGTSKKKKTDQGS